MTGGNLFLHNLGATRMVDMGTEPVQNIACDSGVSLLFTFVTSQFGFDTALSISNISLDPFGTKPVFGRAWLHFYGTNAPAVPPETPVIAPGKTWACETSEFAPNFQGYVIAICDFFPARGMGVMSAPGRRSYTAYLAEVLRVDAPTTQGAKE
jgi:hypothetical protein